MQIGAYKTSYYTNSLNTAVQKQQKAMLTMATGQRVNKAADDAAAMAIAQGMQGQISGLNQAQRNAQDSASMLNVAEGGMNSSAAVMQRMRELTVQASNGTLTDEDRSSIQMEMNQLNAQLNSNAANTQYNGINTNDGTLGGMVSQIGANAGQSMSTSVGNTAASALGINTDVSTQAAAETSLKSVDNGINGLSSIRSTVGTAINGLQRSSDVAASSSSNLQAAQSGYTDQDIAKASTLFASTGAGLYANIMNLSKLQQQQQGMMSLLV